MAEVDILLASYNGEKFIAEQIDSLLAQTFQDFRVLIRDDGSSDRTPEIIAEYERKYPEKIKVVYDDVICHNPEKNFFQLMKYAEADYVMFCDQDDYWLPHKVEITLYYMKKAENENPGKPICVFSAMHIVDGQLQSMNAFDYLSVPEYMCDFSQLLLFNGAAGCTEMINRDVYENMNHYENCKILHDQGTALYSSAFGKVIHIPYAMILYRQHGNNVVGRHGLNGHTQWGGGLSLLKGNIKRVKKFSLIRDRSIIFRSIYAEFMPEEKLKYLNEFINLLAKNRLSRFLILISGKFHIPGSFKYKMKFITKSILC